MLLTAIIKQGVCMKDEAFNTQSDNPHRHCVTLYYVKRQKTNKRKLINLMATYLQGQHKRELFS